MENLAPSLRLALAIRWGLEKGQSCRKSLIDFAKLEEDLLWKQKIDLFIKQFDAGSDPWCLLGEIPESRRAVLRLVEKGLRGQSIYQPLCQLEADLWQMSELELQAFILKLPLKGLGPLFLFQFPALLVLILGPIFLGILKDF